MMDLVQSVLAFVVAIGVLVAVHEFGHFWVARRLGFKVLRFSIGFGRPLLRWHGKDADRVEYWISAIPLGGYVKMLDEREAPVPAAEVHRAFNRRPVPHRILVLLAGPGFNFLFAIAAFWLMFVTGVPGLKPIVGDVAEGSIAAKAGLMPDDEIETVGGRATATWEHATLAFLDELLADGRIDLTVRGADGRTRLVELDVRGREAELTEPAALFTGLGLRPGPLLPPIVSDVTPGQAADRAGIRAGDRVVQADDVEIRAWDQWVEFVRERPGETVQITVERDGKRLTLPLTIDSVEEDGQTIGRIGAWRVNQFPPEVVERYAAEQRYDPIEALPNAVVRTWEMSALTVRMLGRMVIGDVSVKNISGPITIAEYAGDSAAAGIAAFLSFLAVVSLSLGIINLLPVPVLDGGQIVYQVAEWLKGSPLSERAMVLGQQVGVLLLIVLMTFVFYNDLSRIFGS
ncbi:MAG TPA: RIP metalloprotease RseP [Gammaproteobacteria bacterium]